MKRTKTILLGIGLTAASSHAATITSVDTTGIFDEIATPNQLDVEVTAGTLAPFTAAVSAAYAANLGGVIDWESGVAAVASGTSPGHNLTSVTADYGVGNSSTLTVTFDQPMALYTNNIANQVSVLSEGSVANTSNALTTFNVNSTSYTMNFSGVGVAEIGAALPSRSTYGVNGVNFRATANFSSGAPQVLDFLIGGTIGTGDTFLHFAAPSGETIDSMTVTWVDDNGGSLANGQRRPILDDIGFITVPEPSTAGLLGLAALFTAFGRRRR